MTYTGTKIGTLLLAGLAGIALVACGPDAPKETPQVTEPPVVSKPHVTPPVFNADSAYAYVKAQADMGPRTPGSKAHDQAVAYYQALFKRFGATVQVQTGMETTFDGKQWKLENVIATYNPAAQKRVLLCAHYDSRPFCDRDKDPAKRKLPCPGVNDGASGAGVLLEMARQFGLQKPELGIDIILFDLEDYGNSGDERSWCLGSQFWTRNLHVKNYSANYGVLLDMVGAKNAIFPKEEFSRMYAGDIINKIWSTGQRLNYGQYFIDDYCNAMTDDHRPINEYAQIPCVDVLHYNTVANDFFEHHHQSTDDMSNIDKNTLKAVGHTLLDVLYNE